MRDTTQRIRRRSPRAVAPAASRPTRARPTRLLPAALGALLASCVSEPARNAPRASQRPADSAPSRPLASPVLDASTVSRVQFAIEPLARVPFNGQILPVVSPDGRFLATQTGSPPTWPTLLAQPGAEIPASSIVLFDLQTDPPTRIQPAAPTPQGLILSRAASSLGVLVEAPQPDASRHIAILPWNAGPINWLVTGPHVNAHPVLRANDSIAYIQRPPDDPGASVLVLRAADGSTQQWAAPSITPLMPLPCDVPDMLPLIARTPAGLEVITLSLSHGRIASILSRATISSAPSPVAAYQAASVAAAMPASPSITLAHPAFGRAALLDLRSSRATPLLDGSIAATFAEDGLLVATNRDLRFTPMPSESAPPRPLAARVLDTPSIALHTPRHEFPFIVLSPAPDSQEIQVHRLRFTLPEP